MAISARNERLEIAAAQITGATPYQDGVYFRLLRDIDDNEFFDLRWFAWDERRKRTKETTKGIILDEQQYRQLQKAMEAFEAKRKGKGNG